MDALQPTRTLCIFALFLIICAASAHSVPKHDHVEDERIEVYDGVFVNIPKDNSTGRMLSIDVDTEVAEGRGKKKNMMQKIIPMFILPFILQSSLMPLVLGMLKFMLIKSFLVGKLALTLIMINAFKNHNSFKGRDAEAASEHYGYHENGLEPIATYLN
ncbi:hypothetical protein SFRURICE_019821 [Spodoptera frugiperda]|uniref:Uncharacterized protein LOC118265114 n=1 Tax=Spodoptera frugiperda TaxID=7108 RepID=A0A9R0E9W2_SPOFR|nr:uncharacterized protein LOC118265114 [Spodoptera frugiperda]KAF9808663.1 hypothetical protein SFRURICE_019821 [Spodoptera frugiperda]